MNESFDDLHELAGEYVLGTLTSSQRREVEQRRLTEPALRAAVEAWEARLSPLHTLVEEQEPSPDLWSRIARTLSFNTVKPVSNRRIWWDDLRLWRSLSAGGFAIASMLVAFIALRPPSGPEGYMVVLVEPQKQTPGWLVQASLNRNISLTPLQMNQVPAQKNLQFWTKADSWQAPVSLGLVQPGKELKITLDKLPAVTPNQLFEITLEPEGGSTTGKPTGPILFIGRAVRVT
jgi:anti-sigma-K factor RskA